MEESEPHRLEVLSLQPALEVLGMMEEREPPAHLKSRLLSRIMAEPSADEQERGGSEGLLSGLGVPLTRMTTIKKDELAWEPLGEDGAFFKTLSIDREGKRVTMLLRLEAGYSYPAHVHRGLEEVYVLEGDLQGPDFSLEKGDYHLAPAGTRHGMQHTINGCLLLLRGPLHDTHPSNPV